MFLFFGTLKPCIVATIPYSKLFFFVLRFNCGLKGSRLFFFVLRFNCGLKGDFLNCRLYVGFLSWYQILYLLPIDSMHMAINRTRDLSTNLSFGTLEVQ